MLKVLSKNENIGNVSVAPNCKGMRENMANDVSIVGDN